VGYSHLAYHRAALSAYGDAGEMEKLRQTIADADRKLIGYRATLDAGGDPALIAGWIAEITAIKKTAQARLRTRISPPRDPIASYADLCQFQLCDSRGFAQRVDETSRESTLLRSRISVAPPKRTSRV
jgi:hypothetical protein